MAAVGAAATAGAAAVCMAEGRFGVMWARRWLCGWVWRTGGGRKSLRFERKTAGRTRCDRASRRELQSGLSYLTIEWLKGEEGLEKFIISGMPIVCSTKATPQAAAAPFSSSAARAWSCAATKSRQRGRAAPPTPARSGWARLSAVRTPPQSGPGLCANLVAAAVADPTLPLVLPNLDTTLMRSTSTRRVAGRYYRGRGVGS